MKTFSMAALLMAGVAGLALCGCADHTVYAYVPPPPPPPVYQPGPALFDVASRNGFQAGVEDGSRAAYYGQRYEPRRTPAYHWAPGYDANLGPAEPYVNAFRNAYLRGYDKGYSRR